MRADTLDKVAYILVLIGGLNWGIVGLFENDIVGELFGYGSGLTEIVYIAIGAAAAYLTYKLLMAKTARK
jgi:uncharacterized protein